MSDSGARSPAASPAASISGSPASGGTAATLPATAIPAAGPLTAVLLTRSAIAPGIFDLNFSMRTPSRLSFRAGQFVSVAVGPAPGAGTVGRRSYSIASPSDEGDHLRFIIRVIPGGTASEFLMSLPVGAEVPMTGPHGFFILDAHHPGDIVFGATGTGVSAVMPMLGELAKLAKDRATEGKRQPAGSTPSGRRVLYWGVRYQEDLFALNEIEVLCRQASCELRLFLSAPSPSWTGGRGRITAPILADFPGMTAPIFYLVGNGAMISELKRELMAAGVNRKKQIRTEAFFD